MPKRSVPILTLLLVIFGIGFLRWTPSPRAASSQSSAPHQLIGGWRLPDVDDPHQAPSMMVFTSDGTVLRYETGGQVTVGSWSAVTDRAGQLTGYSLADGAEDECPGGRKLGGVAEAGDAGEQIEFVYAVQCVDLTGTLLSERGPITATGSRIDGDPIPQPVATVMTP